MVTRRSTKHVKTTHIATTPKGFSVRTYALPPADFTPLTASPRLLLRHGFPARPDKKTEPQLRTMWDETFARARTWVTPAFREVPEKFHGPAIRPASPKAKSSLRGKATESVANATSSNWSGSVCQAPRGRTFGWVAGQWTVPNPHAPILGSYYASEWIGIDGWGSGDVLQAGTETEIIDLGIFTFRQVYVWWEWFPASEVAITNFAVAAGDTMYCLICVNSSNTATIHLTNQSSGLSTSFSITAPKGTSLRGNSAEWIVERPTINGNVASLSDTKVVYFDEGIAGLAGTPFTLTNLGAGTAVTMTGNGNASLSVPAIETSELMKVNWLKAS
ncbi:MAG: G1 family glutamic endopeptidase [Rhodanobacter sp.]